MPHTEQQDKFVTIFLEKSRETGEYRQSAIFARDAAGYSQNSAPHTIFAMDGIKELLMQKVSIELAQMIPKMLNRLEEVVDQPAMPGAKNVIAAAATLLDRAGLVKVEKQELNVKADQGVLILPAKQQIE